MYYPSITVSTLQHVQGGLCRGLAVNMGVENFSSATHWKPFAKETLRLRQ